VSVQTHRRVRADALASARMHRHVRVDGLSSARMHLRPRGRIGARDFIFKMEYYAAWLLLRMQGGAVVRGHRSCWKQLAKWYQFLELFLLNC
jgi:hypothetical protein